jgi:hypothetical protein
MGYLGTKPANAVLTSEQIGNGVITSADIASGVTINFADGSASTPSITNDGDTNTGIFFPAADTIAFAEGGSEVARFDSSGNLGVGTSSPAYRLDISGGHSRIRGAQAQFWSNSDNTNIVGIYNGAAAGSSSSSGQMIFETGLAERMRIDSSGNLLVNRTSASIAGSTSRFIVEGNSLGEWVTAFNNTRADAANSNFIIFARQGTQTGSISNTTTATSYVTSSDYRLKENIAPMTGALDKVTQLKPVTYTWKADGSEGQGFIAHELAEVVPDAVTGEKDAVDAEGNPQYQGIDTSFLVATLTAAIQEQQAIITELKTRIEALEQA